MRRDSPLHVAQPEVVPMSAISTYLSKVVDTDIGRYRHRYLCKVSSDIRQSMRYLFCSVCSTVGNSPRYVSR